MHFYDKRDIRRIIERAVGETGMARLKSDERNPIGALVKLEHR